MPNDSLPLATILTNVIKEFEKASVAADISREQWRQVYESNALLKEFTPSRIRVSEANISLPLAFDELKKAPEPERAPGLTATQLTRFLPSEIPNPIRSRLASEVIDALAEQGHNTFSDVKLADNAVAHIAMRLGRLEQIRPHPELVETKKHILELIAAAKVNPAAGQEKEAKFVYKTEELEKVTPDRIVRFNLKLNLD